MSGNLKTLDLANMLKISLLIYLKIDSFQLIFSLKGICKFKQQRRKGKLTECSNSKYEIENQGYLPNCCSGKGLKGTVVKREIHF